MSSLGVTRGFDLGDNEQGQEHSRQIQDEINQTKNAQPDTDTMIDKILLKAGVSRGIHRIVGSGKLDGNNKLSPTDTLTEAHQAIKDLIEAEHTKSFAFGYNEGYDEGLKKVAEQVAAAKIKLVEDLISQTAETTTTEAFVTDTGVAQSIRVHTNALLRHILAELKKGQK